MFRGSARIMLAALASVIVICACAPADAPRGPGQVLNGAAVSCSDAAGAEAVIVRELNDVRRENDMREFSRSAGLDVRAKKHSAEMTSRGSLFHQDPAAALDSIRKRGEAGPSLTWAENVGVVPVGNVKGIGAVRNSADAGKAFVRLWMESPGHRANILNARFRNVGIGVVCDGKGSYYGTVDFLGP